MIHVPGNTELLGRCGTVATANHAEPTALSNRMRNVFGSRFETWILKHTEWAIPQHCLGLRNDVAERRRSSRPNVHAHPSVRHALPYLAHLAPGFGVEELTARTYSGDVRRQHDWLVARQQLTAIVNH